MELMIFYFIVIIFSAIIHEYMHGWMADYLGDPTARLSGRLTLNPISHIDLWGSIMLPLMLYYASGGAMIFGYAKPVPFNPYNLRDQKYGIAKVAAAGPLANFFTALFFGLLIRLGIITGTMADFLAVIVLGNLILLTFNLLPVPPLDGSKIILPFLSKKLQEKVLYYERYGIIILLLFVFFGFSNIIIPVINILFKIITGNSYF
jgi:Zn-dependent protease